MKNKLLIAFTLLLSLTGMTQTPGPGSLAFIGFQNNAPDGFAVVLLQNFPGNQVIYFTDNGWSGTALFSNEQTIEWTIPAQGLPAGTTVQFRDDQNGGTIVTPQTSGTVSGVLNNLSAAGEQILAYTGSPSNPSFIAAISSSNWIDVCNSVGEGNTNTTCLPAPLIQGVNAFEFTGLSTPITNGFFNLSNFSGSAADLLALIMNVNNWTLNNNTSVSGFQNWPAWNFVFGAGGSSIVQFASTSQTVLANSTPINVGVNILPASTVNGQISLAYTLSQGLSNTDFSINQTVAGNTFNLDVTTGTDELGFQITLDEDLADNLSEPQTITFSITSTSNANALQIGAVNTFILTINPAPSVETPVLFINEFMAQNTLTIADENGEFDDWIEIYNPSNFEVDLAGMYITDNFAMPMKYQFPFGSDLTKIPANGFRLVWADNQDAQGPMHTNFGLSVNGEVVGLYANDGVTVIDSISFGPQQTDISFGRQQDGAMPWVFFTQPTPGASNSPSSINNLLSENINLFPNPASSQVFLFNKSEQINQARIIISDVQGRQHVSLSQITIYPFSGIALPVNELSSGVYFVTIQNENIFSTHRLVIQK
ncbi:MAG: lamin tail domain-containing protein [Flavobacteriales bacterium]